MDVVIGSLVRHGVSVYGGTLVGQGLITANDLEIATGALVTVVSIGWSLFNKWRIKKGQ